MQLCTAKLKNDQCAYVAYNFNRRINGKHIPHCMYYDLHGKGNNNAVCYYMPYKHPLLGDFWNLTKTSKSTRYFNTRIGLKPTRKFKLFRAGGGHKILHKGVYTALQCADQAVKWGADFFGFGRSTFSGKTGKPSLKVADTECFLYKVNLKASRRGDRVPRQQSSSTDWGLAWFLSTKWADHAYHRFEKHRDYLEYQNDEELVDKFGEPITQEELDLEEDYEHPVYDYADVVLNADQIEYAINQTNQTNLTMDEDTEEDEEEMDLEGLSAFTELDEDQELDQDQDSEYRRRRRRRCPPRGGPPRTFPRGRRCIRREELEYETEDQEDSEELEYELEEQEFEDGLNDVEAFEDEDE